MPISQDIIEHKGNIISIDNDAINVEIIAESACASCHAKGFCTISDMKEKIININKTKDSEYEIGDEVTVLMEKSSGSKAVILGYFLPFLIMFLSLVILINITDNQGLSGMLSIGLLIPYYIILYFLRDKINRKFEFKIRKD